MHCLADRLSAQAQARTSALCPVGGGLGEEGGGDQSNNPRHLERLQKYGAPGSGTNRETTTTTTTSYVKDAGAGDRTGRQRTKMAGRKFTHECQFRAWGVLDALGALKGQRAHLPAPPRRREERPGGAWLARAWGSHPLLRGQFPQPETRARVISWKAKWHGDRISKAQINWLTGIVGLRRGWGGGRWRAGRLGRYR